MNGVFMNDFIQRYSRPAVYLHWIIAALMIANLALAHLTEAFGEESIRTVIDTHKSIGLTVLGLAIMRIIWRLTHKPPLLSSHYKAWEKRASHVVHWALYFLILALPITGWMHDSAWEAAPEIPLNWFGLFELPRIGWIMEMEPAAKKAFHGVMGERHELLGWILIALVLLHIGAALKHQFIDGEKELQRMM
jgi:cytochrome b561